VPIAGVIRVNTPQAGVVLERRVAEGQFVHKGDVLYVLTSDRVGLGARELQADIGLQIGSRKRSMETEIGRNKAVEQQELGSLARRLATLRAEAQSIDRQTEQQKQRVALAEDARKRYKSLADQDYIAREQYTQKEIDLSEQQSRLQQLQRDALANQREISATDREADNTRVRYANQNSLLQRSLSSADQELTEVEGRSRVIITAPESGQATLVAGEVGQAVDSSRPLLNLVPEDAQLEARLYAPSRTIGFVRPGDRVLLRYQSFPYQKFSQHEGVVFAISSAAVPNNELAGFALPELTPGEPVYAITVRLKSQVIRAYGQDRRLQAGMRLDGDILQETRRLYEWMLEPLYSITGKMEH
jgi:membrane fusion protein